MSEAKELAERFEKYVPDPGGAVRLAMNIYLRAYFDAERRMDAGLPLYFISWASPCASLGAVEEVLGRSVAPYEDLK